MFRNFSHGLIRSESVSESSESSNTEGGNEASSSCASSSVNVLVSGTTSVGTCEMMGLGCSTEWISLLTLSFSEMLSLTVSSLSVKVLSAVPMFVRL